MKSTRSAEIRNSALRLARKGLKVFPLRNKKPRFKGGFHKATTDLNQIHEWWQEWPDSNIGLRLGPELFVLDIDGPRGHATLKHLEAKHSPLPETLSQSTGREEGMHKFFLAPKECCNTRLLGDKLETKGDGGYVVLAPSVSEEHGRQYKWLNDSGIEVAPNWLVKLLEKREGKKTRVKKWALAALTQECEELTNAQHGERNIRANKVLFRAGQLAAGCKLDEQETLERIRNACAACGLEREEIRTLFREDGPFEAGTEDPVTPEDEKPVTQDKTEGIQLIRASDVETKPITWLWHPWIPSGMITTVEGPGGVGKSTLVLDLIARLSRGGTLPTGEDVPAGKSIVCSAEDAYSQVLKPRLEAAGANLTNVQFLEGYVEDGELRLIELPSDLAALEAKLQGVRILLIDPLTAYLGEQLDMNNDHGIRRALTPLHRVAEQANCAVLVIRHFNKRVSGPAMNRGLGSVGIGNASRSVLQCIPVPDTDGYVLAQAKGNLAKRPRSLRYSHEDTDGVLRIAWNGACDITADALADTENFSALDEARDFLTSVLANGPLPATQVKEQADQADISESTLKRAKRTLVRADRQGTKWIWCLREGQGDHVEP